MPRDWLKVFAEVLDVAQGRLRHERFRIEFPGDRSQHTVVVLLLQIGG